MLATEGTNTGFLKALLGMIISPVLSQSFYLAFLLLVTGKLPDILSHLISPLPFQVNPGGGTTDGKSEGILNLGAEEAIRNP